MILPEMTQFSLWRSENTILSVTQQQQLVLVQVLKCKIQMVQSLAMDVTQVQKRLSNLFKNICSLEQSDLFYNERQVLEYVWILALNSNASMNTQQHVLSVHISLLKRKNINCRLKGKWKLTFQGLGEIHNETALYQFSRVCKMEAVKFKSSNGMTLVI